VPGVDDHLAHVGTPREPANRFPVALEARERVVEGDVDRLLGGGGRIEFHDVDPIPIRPEPRVEPAHDHLVVVDEGHPDAVHLLTVRAPSPPRGRMRRTGPAARALFTPRGVCTLEFRLYRSRPGGNT